MNRIYKVVFNRKKGMLVVASELAKTAVKSGTKLVAATVVGSLLVAGGVQAQTVTDVTTVDPSSKTTTFTEGAVQVNGDIGSTGTASASNLHAASNLQVGDGASPDLVTITANSNGLNVNDTVNAEGLDANSKGITKAGAISGATTITASDRITGVGVDAGAGQITGTAGMNVSGASTLGATTVSSLTATTADIDGGTIDNAAITGGTINNAAITG